MITYDADPGHERELTNWCHPGTGAHRLIISIEPDLGAGLDGFGHPAHLVWRINTTTANAMVFGAVGGDEPIVWRSDPGSYRLPCGGSVAIHGGVGRWKARVWHAQEKSASRARLQRFWLTSSFATDGVFQTTKNSERFRGHGAVRVIEGSLTYSTGVAFSTPFPITPGRKPVSLALALENASVVPGTVVQTRILV